MNQTRTKPTSLAATAFCATISQSVSSSRQVAVQNLDGAYSLYKMANPEGVEYGNEVSSMADFYEKYLNENLNLIDVREVHEFQAGHAPEARNLPLSTLEQGYKELKP